MKLSIERLQRRSQKSSSSNGMHAMAKRTSSTGSSQQQQHLDQWVELDLFFVQQEFNFLQILAVQSSTFNVCMYNSCAFINCRSLPLELSEREMNILDQTSSLGSAYSALSRSADDILGASQAKENSPPPKPPLPQQWSGAGSVFINGILNRHYQMTMPHFGLCIPASPTTTKTKYSVLSLSLRPTAHLPYPLPHCQPSARRHPYVATPPWKKLRPLDPSAAARRIVQSCSVPMTPSSFVVARLTIAALPAA